jgi:RHS repeat-associated protein
VRIRDLTTKLPAVLGIGTWLSVMAVIAGTLVACNKGQDPEDIAPVIAAVTASGCSFTVKTNVYDPSDWTGTLVFQNNGPSDSSNYKVEFDIPSGRHCNDYQPPGAVLSPLGSGGLSGGTVSNHCVFTWTNTTPLTTNGIKSMNYSTDSNSSSFTSASNVVISDPVCGGAGATCNTFAIKTNKFVPADLWGTIAVVNGGPTASSSYTVAFDVAAGKFCTDDAVPSGATLLDLVADADPTQPKHTATSHCVFNWPAGPALAVGATLTFNYSTDSAPASFTSASSLVATDAACSPDSMSSRLPPTETPPAPEPKVGSEFGGMLQGQFGVSPTGAATYTVPIGIPPGVAGIAPNLSLIYNSQSGDGLAGQGWELSGLSAIHRCPKSRAQDGSTEPVQVTTSSDGLCLDGERLHRVLNGTSDWTYYTEFDQFANIGATIDNSLPNSSLKISKFTVTTKSGEVRTYGAHQTTRVKWVNAPANGAQEETLMWLLDRVADPWGNYFDVHYNDDHGHESTASGFLQDGVKVTSIDYTGFVGTSAAGPRSPFWRVSFGYEPRQDVRTLRFAFVAIPKKYRLTNIKVATPTAPSNPLATYTLTYLTDDTTRMLPSRLKSIQYCVSGTAGSCQQPLEFVWEGGGYGWTSRGQFSLGDRIDRRDGGKSWGTVLTDLNADGRVDFVSARPGKMQVEENDGSSLTPNINWELPIPLVDADGNQKAMLTDMNDDGLVDVVGPPASANAAPPVWINHLKDGGGWVPITIPAPSSVTSRWGTIDFNNTAVYALTDMNGDGRADIVKFGNPGTSSVEVFWNLAAGWQRSLDATPPVDYGFSGLGIVATCHLRDINRDGMTDVMCPGAFGINVGPVGANGSAWQAGAFVAPPLFDYAPPVSRSQGDIDGDGYFDAVTIYPYKTSCPDFVEATPQGGTPQPRLVNVSTGNGFDDAAPAYLAALNIYMLPASKNFGSGGSVICPEGNYIRNHIYALTDLNADGLADLVLNHDDGLQTPHLLGGQLLVNTGTTWRDYDGVTNQRTDGAPVTPVPFGPTDATLSGYPGNKTLAVAYVDLDSDGVVDVVETSANSSGVVSSEAWINEFKPALIKSFPNGLAKKDEVVYTTISEKTGVGVYTDNEPLQPGTTYLGVPIRVVKQVTSEDGRGLGLTANTKYSYKSVRASSTGRGPQGFKEVTVVDEASGTTTTTTYAQAYPYTGRVLSVSKSRNGIPLSLTSTDYCDSITEVMGQLQCTDPTGPANGDYYTPPSKPIFVYVKDVADITFVRGPADQSAPFKFVTSLTDYRYDSRGNPTKTDVIMSSTNTGETIEKTVVNTYGTGNTDEDIRGRVKKSVVTTQRTAPPGDAIVHTTEFEYDSADPAGLGKPLALLKKKIEPGAGVPFELHTAYAYDPFGNVITTTACQGQFAACAPGAANPANSADPPFRTSTTSYDPADFNAPQATGLVSTLGYTQKGRFAVKSTNALGHNEFFAYEPFHGSMLQKTAINGLHSCYGYDAFGFKTSETERCGTSTPLVTTMKQYLPPTLAPSDPEAAAVAGAAFITVVRPPTGIVTWTYTDALARTIRTRVRGFAGEILELGTKSFDSAGRVTTETKARVEGDATFKTVTTYDAMGRVDTVTQDLGVIDNRGAVAQDLTTTTYTNTGDVSTQRTIAGVVQTHSESKNVMGKVSSVKDANGKVMTFVYDADGNLTDTTDSASNTVHTGFDVRGRRTLSRDPDMGEWKYEYNGFGDLLKQTDARGKVVTMSYDVLGRMLTKTDTTLGGTANWVYDTAPGAGVGKVAAMAGAPDSRLSGNCTIPGITATSGERAGKSYRYTGFGQLDEIQECVDGTTYKTSYDYDSAGRQRTVRYPDVKGSRLTLNYAYTSTGYLFHITDAADGMIYWAAKEVNAQGQVTREITRNGVETVGERNDATGWLMGSTSTAHSNGEKAIQEWKYTFDETGNLRTRDRTDDVVAADSSETFGYDRLNRLTSSRVKVPSKSYDVTESFSYDDLGNITAKGGSMYTYNTCSAGPHAVCAVGTTSSFAYDANGNMTSGRGRTVTYTGQNRPLKFTQGTTTAEFIYGADGDRIVELIGGSSPARTLYVGLGATGKSMYEKTTRGSVTDHVQFIYAGGTHSNNAFALRVTTDDGSSAPVAMKYYTFDHLGSVTSVSDDKGRVVGATSGNWTNSGALGYDAWGARRNPDGRSADPTTFKQQAGRREFTGHEVIPGLTLVNMNGRVYDAVLGRFLSPDPTVQLEADMQNYNRYSYVHNNPLRYTDPTGYGFWGTMANIGVGLAFAAAGAVCVASGGTGCGAIAIVGALVNTEVAMAQGASAGGVVAANIIGMFAGGIGSGVGTALGQGFMAQLANGAVSGAIGAAISTELTGGQRLGWNIFQAAAMGALVAGASYTASAAVSATSSVGEDPPAHGRSAAEPKKMIRIEKAVQSDAADRKDSGRRDVYIMKRRTTIPTAGAIAVAQKVGNTFTDLENHWWIETGDVHGTGVAFGLKAINDTPYSPDDLANVPKQLKQSDPVTWIADHSQEGAEGVTRIKLNNVDAACVERKFVAGQEMGRWSIFGNSCQAFVKRVVEVCTVPTYSTGSP